MSIPDGSLLGRVALRFGPGSSYVPSDLSAASLSPDGSLWLAADERAAIDVLRPSAPLAHELGGHRCFPLAGALGVGEDDEVDIEGLAMDPDAGAVWVVGSHGAKRKKPKGAGSRADLARLATVETEPARSVLARVPIADGEPDLAAGKVARLGANGGATLLDLLEGDEHLGAFLPSPQKGAPPPIPGKDNGFDVEGLACLDGRLLVGLRGPVLRGWAFVLELELAEGGGGALEARARGKRRYRKHALDLDGLGVRELVVRGPDVLVLAGPTMALDGAHRLFRWRRGPRKGGDSVVAQEKGVLEPLFDLPWAPGSDRAEGLARFQWFEDNDSVLVVYDTPSRWRRVDERTVLADVFAVR